MAEQSESGASVAGSVPADRQLKMDAIWLVRRLNEALG